MARTWPEDWDDRVAGKDCPMCLQGRPDDYGYGLRFFAGEIADAYLQREKLTPGYTVVVWRGRHVTEPFHLSEGEGRAYWQEVRIAAQALMRRYQPAKMNYQVLGNSVPHLHTHLVPRYLDDPNPERPLYLDPGDDVIPEDTLQREVKELREIVHSLQREDGQRAVEHQLH